MIQFANPVWLWGLLGLLIPVGIHLLSRKEGKVIPIGSLRHLKESDTAQFSSIRLNEVLLLLLRCLLITLVILILAGAGMKNAATSAKKWLVLESGIEKEQALKSLIDSLSAQGYELRMLAKEFPLLVDSSHHHHSSTNYWALAEDLGARPQHDIVVVSYNYIHGFKGKRPALPANIRWITHEPVPATYRVKVVATASDSSWVRTAQTSSGATTMTTSKEKRSPGGIIENGDTIVISIFHDAQFSNDVEILEASLGAIQTIIPYKITVDKKPATQYQATSSDWIIWFSDEVLPAVDLPSIAYNPCAGALQPLIIRGEQATVRCAAGVSSDWVITRRLTNESAIDESLSLSLATILLSNKGAVPVEKDRRSMAAEIMWSTVSEEKMHKTKSIERSSLDAYLAVALFLSLIAERWLACKRNQ
jgi:hypothetical protein